MSSDIASVEIERLRKRVDELEFWLSTILRALSHDSAPEKPKKARKKA